MSETLGRSLWGFKGVLFSSEVDYVSFDPGFNVECQTLKIDFGGQKSLEDRVLAHGCVVVLTNDGEAGTLSHLTTENDGRRFAQDLRDQLGRPSIPVCLVGGDETLSASLSLVTLLVEQLPRVGFKLRPRRPYSDILGSFLRQTTLTPTGVHVRRLPIQTGLDISKVINLKFP